MVQEEARTELGLIRVHENVISSIASIAVIETPGIKSVAKGLRTSIMELLGKKGHSNISVNISKNEEVKIEVPVVVKYGFNIPEVASMAQDNIRQALEKMTNLLIKDININVTGIERG